MPSRRFFSGDTVEQALLSAGRHYQLEPNNIAYEQIEKRHGFLKVRRKVVIAVDDSAPRKGEAAELPPPAPALDGSGSSSEASTTEEAAERPVAVKGGKGGGEADALDRESTEQGPRALSWHHETESVGDADEAASAVELADEEPAAESPSLGDGWLAGGSRSAATPSAPVEEVTGSAAGEEIGDGGAGKAGVGVEVGSPAPSAPVEQGAAPEARTRPRRPRRRRQGGDLVELPEAPRRAIERFPRAEGEVAEAAQEALRRLLQIAGLDLSYEVMQGDERLEVELWGTDEERLLADRGKLLLSIQHLVPRLVRGLTGEAVHCRADCDNFHEIRAERLRTVAQRAAAEVAQNGRPRTLEPMAPDERRIVHLTLADDAGVETASQGEGLYKRVTVRPTRGGGRGSASDRFRR